MARAAKRSCTASAELDSASQPPLGIPETPIMISPQETQVPKRKQTLHLPQDCDSAQTAVILQLCTKLYAEDECRDRESKRDPARYYTFTYGEG